MTRDRTREEDVTDRFRRIVGRRTRLALLGAVLAGALGIIRSRRIVHAGGQRELPRLRGPQRLRRFVTERFDPLVSRLGLVGGGRSPWAMLEHISGVPMEYRRLRVFSRRPGTLDAVVPTGKLVAVPVEGGTTAAGAAAAVGGSARNGVTP